MNEKYSLDFIRSQIKPLSDQLSRPSESPPGYKCAAVIIPLIEAENELCVLFTKRTNTVRDHQNQISFPGGGCEFSDNTFLDTAIREMREEIGIQIAVEAVLGALAPRKTVTGYYITPFIAYIDSKEKITINSSEVVRIIKVPFVWLADG